MEGNSTFARRVARLVAVAAAMWASAAVAAPTATLIDPTARLDYGATGGNVTMVLQVDGLDAQAKQNSDLVQNLHDLDQPNPPNVTVDIKAEERAPSGSTARTWLLLLRIAGLPANSTQKRYLALDVGGKSVLLDYTLTNKAVANFSWTVKAPPSIAICPGQAIPLAISVGPVPATGITLINPHLVEKTRKSLIAPSGLRLCRNPGDPCNDEKIDIPASSVTQLWLRGAEGVGQYEGTVTVASTEKPEGDAVPLTVYSTRRSLQVLGIIAIFGGVLLAWVVTVFGRNLLNRDQLLLPAALLRERIAALQPRLNANPTGIATPNLTTTITRLLGALSPTALTAAGLPRWFPVSSNALPSADQLDTYRRTLQGAADWAADLEAIVHEGLEHIWSHWNAATPAQQAAITAAITALDLIAAGIGGAPAIDSVRQQIRTQVNTVNTALGVAPLGGAAPVPKTYDQLNVQIIQISAISWALVIVATTAVGTLALVINNTFGSFADFVTCILWGLGLPIAGQALTASMGTVGTSLGVSVSK